MPSNACRMSVKCQRESLFLPVFLAFDLLNILDSKKNVTCYPFSLSRISVGACCVKQKSGLNFVYHNHRLKRRVSRLICPILGLV